MLSLLVWLMFGVIAVVQASQSLTWQAVAYAVLSLTVILMLAVAVAVAVAVALAGAGLGRPAVLFAFAGRQPA
jgi:uncharacterized membrane protein